MEKIRGNQMRKDVRKIAIGGVCVLTGVLLIFGIKKGITALRTEKTEMKKGVEVIRKLEQADISQIEGKILELERSEMEANPELYSQSMKARFANALVLGDSITEGFVEYDFLRESSVIAELGMKVTDVTEKLDTIRTLNPQTVFLSYGMNDIAATEGDAESFKQNYKEVLKNLREVLPEAVIYINSIFPVQQVKIDESPEYAALEPYNQALREVGVEEGVTFIDNTGLIKEEYYQPDGVHLAPEIYPLWLENMAEVANL